MSELAPLMKTVRMPAIETFDTVAGYAVAAATRVAVAIDATLTMKNGAVLAVPGGSTARDILPALVEIGVAWERVTIALADERWVPPNHADSNERLVRSLLPREANVVGLFDAGKDWRTAARDLERRIPTPDVTLLGMGEDGHIASLFPGDASNKSNERFAIVERPDHPRVTMTPPCLAVAREIILAVRGPVKAGVIEKARKSHSASVYPVVHVLARARVFIGP